MFYEEKMIDGVLHYRNIPGGEWFVKPQPNEGGGNPSLARDYEKEVINDRATQLESIGFVFKVSGNSTWYEKGGVKMIPTLMMCASEGEWQRFIEENKEPSPDRKGEDKPEGEQDSLWDWVGEQIKNSSSFKDLMIGLKANMFIRRLGNVPKSGKVYSRQECAYQYCPHQELCWNSKCLTCPSTPQVIPAKTKEGKPWPFNGYAPGNYMNKCSVCEKQMQGVDKLCFVCLECAVTGAQQILEEYANQFIADPKDEIPSAGEAMDSWRSFKKKFLEPQDVKTFDSYIQKHIGQMFDSLEIASVKYFIETGTINGGFRNRLINMLSDFLLEYDKETASEILATDVKEAAEIKNEIQFFIRSAFLVKEHTKKPPEKIIEDLSEKIFNLLAGAAYSKQNKAGEVKDDAPVSTNPIIQELKEWATKEKQISMGLMEGNRFAPGEIVVWELLLDKLASASTASPVPTKWALNLQSLTPGGSEFVDDPDYCLQVIRERMSSEHELLGQWVKRAKAAEEKLAVPKGDAVDVEKETMMELIRALARHTTKEQWLAANKEVELFQSKNKEG